MRWIYYILLVGYIFSCQSKSSKQNILKKDKVSNTYLEKNINNQTIEEDSFFVYKVVDGDTFYCFDKNKNELKVRLIGIDAPETRNRFKKKKGYYGEEAKSFLTDMILNKYVKLEFDLDKYDQYNRVLAYVYLEDGTFVNLILIKEGYARIMTIQPNSKYSEVFYEEQINARNNKRGLWAVEEY